MWGGIEGSKWRRQQLRGERSKEEGGKQVQSKHTKASRPRVIQVKTREWLTDSERSDWLQTSLGR